MKAQASSAAATARKPLILLFDPRSTSDRVKLSDWLAAHSFSSYEASDTLDAIELISDFTTENFPEVVTIPRDVHADVTAVSQMICSFMNPDLDLPVFLYSRERNAGARCLSIEEVAQWLESGRNRGEI
ncbi:MAG: hypothetical protein PSX80_02460 [bacterium]|nr:hypothetical protein [bacterium]